MEGLQGEKGIICVYVAQSKKEKIFTSIESRWVPCYATKMIGTKIVFHRVKMGAMINTIKKFMDNIFEIDIYDVESFSENPRILFFPFNISFPRYQLKTKNGDIYYLVIPGMQKVLAGKDRYIEGKEKEILGYLSRV